MHSKLLYLIPVVSLVAAILLIKAFKSNEMYAILSSPIYEQVLVSINSSDYAEYRLLGYTEVFTGTRKECLKELDKQELFT